MAAEWTTSPSAGRVLQHTADSRPAWLWSQDGETLLWHNDAAKLFLAKIKKHGLKLAEPAVPIQGQVARNIRLGSPGRSSLARIQFLAGSKPASGTCATTPLPLSDGQMALLIVGVDPIDPEIVAALAQIEPPAMADAGDWADTEQLSEPVAEDGIAAVIVADEDAYQRELDNWHAAEPEPDVSPRLVVSDAETTLEDEPAVLDAGHSGHDAVEPEMASGVEADEMQAVEIEHDEAPDASAVPALEDEVAEASIAPHLFRVTGRGFTADQAETDEPDEIEATRVDLDPEDATPIDDEDAAVRRMEAALADIAPLVDAAMTPPVPPDAEAVERVSRYNFDELSRILNDRVGDTAPQPQPQAPANAVVEPSRSGSLVNLGGETLVLNRLPLGIMVFRDQQVLFANRAITEMVGYDSVENLRAAGLAAIFPATDADGQQAGPVNHLVQRDGTLVPVTARLQSMSWQGRPALMLSASATEVRTGHEAAVRAFAESFADTRRDGFFDTNRAGMINAINGRAAKLMGLEEARLAGAPLSSIITPADGAALREFLERPARFAETARPAITLRGVGRNTEIMLFAQGQAGVLSGYFGLVHAREAAPAMQIAGPADVDSALLARISRGVRRPLNTIIGFADMIRSGAFGAAPNARYDSYADDITTAGHEIAALVDELDDFTRLRDGRYMPQRASIDLTGLLESCVVRIRQQASGARVIVRNAISERLPKVTADRASLAQAVLNLLASAIDQTPSGGAVVISAQREDDGSIAIHVRDSSSNSVDMAERFVVFRDGVGRNGQMLAPVRSSVGLALTRSLLAVNAFSLSVDPAGNQGMLFSLVIPADLVDQP